MIGLQDKRGVTLHHNYESLINEVKIGPPEYIILFM